MYIGLDIGTSGVKAVLFSETGEMIKRACREYPVRGEGQQLELCPQEVCGAVIDALRGLSGMRCEIRAIGISSLGEACVLLDKDGKVLRNAILPGDKRGAEYLPEIKKNENEIIRTTGLPLNATYSLLKLLWVREHEPGLYEKTKRVLRVGDYIAYMLTGEACISFSLASRTLAFDIHKMKFPSSLFGCSGIDPALFSSPVNPEGKIGGLLPEIARRTGLPSGTPVYAGGHDQPCAAIGAGAFYKGEAADSIGTSECITAVLGEEKLEPDFIKDTNFPCEPFLVNGMFNTIAFTHTAGRLLKWFTESVMQAGEKESFHALDLQCKESPSGLLVLPHFSGAGTPTMDHLSVGAVVGLNLHSSAIDIYQAIMESVSYEMKTNLDRLSQNGIKLHRIYAVGGGASSDIWLQYKANIYGVPVRATKCKEASALGAAAAAAVGDGCYGSMEEASKNMVHVKKEYLPDRKLAPAFSAEYEKYKRLYEQIKGIYREG